MRKSHEKIVRAKRDLNIEKPDPGLLGQSFPINYKISNSSPQTLHTSPSI